MSTGRLLRGVGWTRRQHTFLPDLECASFYALDFADEVTNKREQYLLFPLEEMKLIVEKFGKVHTKYSENGLYITKNLRFHDLRDRQIHITHMYRVLC